MTITVADLTPGDRLTIGGPFGEQSGTFVQRCIHPIWPNLLMVIWRMDDGTWMHDALAARQEIPGAVDRAADPLKREARLRKALLGEATP